MEQWYAPAAFVELSGLWLLSWKWEGLLSHWDNMFQMSCWVLVVRRGWTVEEGEEVQQILLFLLPSHFPLPPFYPFFSFSSSSEVSQHWAFTSGLLYNNNRYSGIFWNIPTLPSMSGEMWKNTIATEVRKECNLESQQLCPVCVISEHCHWCYSLKNKATVPIQCHKRPRELICLQFLKTFKIHQFLCFLHGDTALLCTFSHCSLHFNWQCVQNFSPIFIWLFLPITVSTKPFSDSWSQIPWWGKSPLVYCFQQSFALLHQPWTWPVPCYNWSTSWAHGTSVV